MFNGKFSIRYNKFIRKIFIIPKLRDNIKHDDYTLISNNCLSGFVLHDFGQEFKTPTINLYFPELDYFYFLENLEFYLSKEVIENIDIDECPCGIIKGDENHKDIRIRFAHYKSFEEAKKKWDARKKRINLDKLFIVWSYVGIGGDTNLYKRFEQLPFKNKIAFINKDISEKFPSHFYIKGFENQCGVGQLGEFTNLKGNRFYDQFDWCTWINNGCK